MAALAKYRLAWDITCVLVLAAIVLPVAWFCIWRTERHRQQMKPSFTDDDACATTIYQPPRKDNT